MVTVIGIVGILLFLAALVWEDRIRALMLIRIPLVFALVLVLGPFVLRDLSLSKNLFILDEWWELAFVLAMATMHAYACVYSVLLTLRYGHERFDIDAVAWLSTERDDEDEGLARHLFRAVVAMALLVGPLVYVLARAWDSSTGAFLAGVGAALAVVLVLVWLLQKTARLFRKIVDASSWDMSRWKPSIVAGYVRPDEPGKGKPHVGHLRATAALFVTAILYTGFAYLVDPSQPLIDRLPALAFVFILFLLLVTLLSGVAFFLDRFRFPLLITAILLTLVVRTWSNNDHYFEVFAAKGSKLELATTPEVLATLGSQERGRCAVVVCAFGGGIQAASWTATVLTRLHERMDATNAREPFRNSLAFISGVSGGSVGAMQYLEGWRRRGGRLRGDDFAAIRTAAGHSSLGAVGWALVFHDFRRLLPLVADGTTDRALAVEAVWRRSLDERGIDATDQGLHALSLGDLGKLASSSRFPGVVFNATGFSDGDRTLFGSVEIPHTYAHTVCDDYPGGDLLVSSAVRLSATFPYVSPLARARTNTALHLSPEHLGDGGYFDASGVVTGIEWSLEALEAAGEHRVDRVALVLIPAFGGGWAGIDDGSLQASRAVSLSTCVAAPASDPEAETDGSPLVNSVLGPIQLLLRANSGSQTVRGEFEVELLTKIVAASGSDRKKRLAIYAFAPTGAPGILSWHLTDQERAQVEAAWKSEHDQKAAHLQRFIERGGP